MALVYHNITPPEYFLGVHKDLVKLCFRGRRELTAYIDRCELALGDSEYNRQELEALGFRRTGVLPVVPDFTHLDVTPPTAIGSPAGFDDEWTNVLFVGRVIPNKKFEDVIRAFHVYRTRHNPRSRLLLVGSYSGFERYLAMLHALVAQARHARRPLPRPRLERGADRALRRRRSLPLRERARRLLRPDRRGVLQARAGARLRGDRRAGDDGRRRRALRHEGSRSRSRALMDAVLDDADAGGGGRRVAGRRARRGCGARTSAARCCGSSTSVRGRPPRPAPEVAWDFWAQFDQFERLEELRQFRPGAVPRAAGCAGPGRAAEPRAPIPSPVAERQHDRQPVGAGGAPRGRHRRQRAAGARHAARARATTSELFALTIDDDLRGDVRPFADAGARARRRHDLPFRAAVADDRGVRHARRRRGCCSTTTSRRRRSSRRTTPQLFRLAALGRQELAIARRAGRPGARRLRVQPAGARGARLRADRRHADCRRHRRASPARRAGPRSRRSSATG